MAIAAVVFARDLRELAQLPCRQGAVRDGNAQHVGMELEVEPVGEAQRLELLLRQLACKTTTHLVAELLDALLQQGAIEIVVTVEIGIRHSAPPRLQSLET